MITILISGNLGNDAEVREINGKKYARFTVASTRNGKDGKETTWVECLKADSEGKLTPYLTKGSTVSIVGGVTLTTYEGRDGTTRAKLTCWVNELQLLGGKPAQTIPAPAPAAKPKPTAPPRFPVNTEQMNALREQLPSDNAQQEGSVDDLPF